VLVSGLYVSLFDFENSVKLPTNNRSSGMPLNPLRRTIVLLLPHANRFSVEPNNVSQNLHGPIRNWWLRSNTLTISFDTSSHGRSGIIDGRAGRVDRGRYHRTILDETAKWCTPRFKLPVTLTSLRSPVATSHHPPPTTHTLVPVPQRKSETRKSRNLTHQLVNL
jgi:hypothetical protein